MGDLPGIHFPLINKNRRWYGLLGTESPGRPPRLSHSWTLLTKCGQHTLLWCCKMMSVSGFMVPQNDVSSFMVLQNGVNWRLYGGAKWHQQLYGAVKWHQLAALWCCKLMSVGGFMVLQNDVSWWLYGAAKWHQWAALWCCKMTSVSGLT